MRVREIMSDPVLTVRASLPAEDAWQLMLTRSVRHLVVSEGGRVVGTIGAADLGGRIGGSLRTAKTVADLMDCSPVTVAPHDVVRRAANLMRSRHVDCLPVVDRERLVGIVTLDDLLAVIGGGADRPSHQKRAALHHRVAHKKAMAATGRW
ncbi:MAG TPA: CBS domain-containing protein [Vicinamibacterales bacterium]|nr:CBS domain-containing protein [Vicinamibacterales bacterium]